MNSFKVNPSALAFGSVVLSFAAGGVAGYFLAKQQLEAALDEEIQAFKSDYAIRMQEHANSLTLAAQNVVEKEKISAERIIKSQGYDGAVLVESPERNRIFDNAKAVPDWDEERELAVRSEESIYIITQKEYYDNDTDASQEQLTYYEGDDVLAMSNGDLVTDVVGTVGNDCLVKFGYGSNDENSVYVRNETLEIDYEILRADGKYSELILGLGDEDEIRHSDRPRRFRPHHE